MRKNIMFSRFLTILISISILMSSIQIVSASGGTAIQATLDGDVITINGTVNPKEEVNIFLLNDGKKVADLNVSATGQLFDETVNYVNVVTANATGGFADEFQIDGYSAEGEYLLYIKTETESFTKSFMPAKIIYVSASGDDANGDGSETKPYATIEKAKQTLSNIERTAPIEVIISEGTYNLSEGIVFAAEDSGTEDYPITYKAEKDAKVVLTGTTQLDVSNLPSIQDANVKAMLSEAVADKVVEIELSGKVPSDVINFLENLKAGESGKPMGVYLNDEPQTISRWPNIGYATIASGSTEGGSVSGSTQEQGGAVVNISNLDETRAAKWQNETNIYVEGYLGNDWHREWAKVGSISSNSAVTLNTYTQYGVVEGSRIAVVNALSEIDAPGEWYVDGTTMYYYPPHKLTANDKFEIAILKDNFITVSGAKYLNFEGIEFAKNVDDPTSDRYNTALGNGITINQESANININNCIFRDIGIDGVVIDGSTNINVDGCFIYDVGYSAVAINSGDRKTQTSGNVVVSNSVISKINRDSGANSIAGIRLGGVGNIIENNIFHDIKNSAIRYEGNGHIIRNNEIYNVVNETADAGAIYAGRSWSSYGTSIENNYFHDVGAEIDTSYHASAVFWDDAHSGNSFTGNLVDMGNKVKTSAVKIGGGRDNTVDGNIFVNSLYGVFGEDREINPPTTYDREDSTSFYNQTVFKTFKDAANNVENAYDITPSDWLESYISLYPNIKKNFEEIRDEQKYTRVNTITNNTAYDCTNDIQLGAAMDTASTKSNNTIGSGNPTFDMTYIGINNNDVLLKVATEAVLTYPKDKENLDTADTILKWDESPYADKYIYEVSKTADFATLVISGETSNNMVDIGNLEEDTVYYWRVKTINTSEQLGGTYTSAVSSFSVRGGISMGSISYDSEATKFTVELTNTKASDEMMTVIVAIKAGNGRLISVKAIDITLAGDSVAKSEEIIADLGTAELGYYAEVYIWKSLTSMVNLTTKEVYNR